MSFTLDARVHFFDIVETAHKAGPEVESLCRASEFCPTCPYDARAFKETLLSVVRIVPGPQGLAERYTEAFVMEYQ